MDLAGRIQQEVRVNQVNPATKTPTTDAELKQALETAAATPELRTAIWTNAQTVVTNSQSLTKAHCEQIVATYFHNDPNAMKAFAILFPSIALAFAKFLENPNQDLQVMMNGKLIDVYLKLKDGDLVVTNLIPGSGNKKEKTLLTLVPHFLTSAFANGTYKNLGTPAQRFQPQHQPGQPQVYQPREQVPFPPQGQWNQQWGQQHQVNHSPFAPVQGQPQPGQHYQPMQYLAPAHQPFNTPAPNPVLGPRPELPSDFGTIPAFSKFDMDVKEIYDSFNVLANVKPGQRNGWKSHFDRHFDNFRKELFTVPPTTGGYAARSNFLQTYQNWINNWVNAKQ